MLQFVFFTVESLELLRATTSGAPNWEVALMFGGCVGMLVNCGIGFAVLFGRVLPVLFGARREA